MTASDSIMPAGGRFLPGHGTAALRRRHGEEGDPATALRLLAYARRKEGATIRRICADIGRPYGTVRGWLVRAARRGIAGRHPDPIPGRPCRLDGSQLARLRADLIAGPRSCGFESDVWIARLLIVHLRRRYGVEYGTDGIYCLLHGMGFSRGRPRPRHPKSASEPEKKRFKKKARACAKHYRRRGYAVMAADESSHMISWNIKNGWYPRGRPATTPVCLSRNRSCPYGALGPDGFHCRSCDKNNTDSFTGFLAGLRARFGRVLLFAGNAGYHRSARLRRRLAGWDGDVVIRYLPPYTPEPSPAGVQWRMTRKATANALYSDTAAMKKSVRGMLRRGEIGVAEMSSYLLR